MTTLEEQYKQEDEEYEREIARNPPRNRRINFIAWGLGELKCPAYAVGYPEEDADVVANAIARKNGLQVITLQSQGVSLPAKTRHYSTTLGHPCRRGGWTPVKQVGFGVLRRQRT